MIDTKALREKILDLAMRGKLVPQDPDDEPASELLKRIKAEKEELIKQKKIKRDKNETEIFRGDDGLHYEKFADGTITEIETDHIPLGWSLVRLPKLVELENRSIKRGPFGSAIKKSMFVPSGKDTYKVYEQGNAIRATYDYGNYYLSGSDFERLESFEVLPRDIIISCAGTIGRSYLIPEDAPKGVINQALLRLTINEDVVDINFFLLAFQNQVEKLNDDAAGTAMKNLGSVKYLKSDLIWLLPPVSEQKRIMQKYYELKSMIDSIEQEQNSIQILADQLKKTVLDVAMQGKLVPQDPNDEPASVLLEKIRAEKKKLYEEGKIKKKDLVETEIVKCEDNAYYEKIPKDWVGTALGNVVNLISGRDLKSTQYSDEATEGMPYITGASNFVEGTIETTRYTSEPQVKSISGDILVSVKGTIGELAINPFEHAHIARQVMAIRPYLLDHLFVLQYLDSRIEEMKSKAQSMIPGISREVLLRMNIIIPPLNEQRKILETLTQIQKVLHQFH